MKSEASRQTVRSTATSGSGGLSGVLAGDSTMLTERNLEGVLMGDKHNPVENEDLKGSNRTG